jgi:putative ABC transport system permease protein
MIKNYVLVAIRNLTRDKFFSFINIFGLAVSMSICMAIIMLVADQMLYDRHNSESQRIFRINSRPVNNAGVYQGGMDNATSPPSLRSELLENYTGIEKVVRLRRGFGNNWLVFEGQDINIPLTGFFADPEVLSFFKYELEYGDESTALTKPFSVVLTRIAADKLFKQENPVGLTLKVGDTTSYTVTGVLKETTHKSHIVFEGLASMSTVKDLSAQYDDSNNWQDFWNGWTYILIAPGKPVSDIQSHLDKIYKKHIASITHPDAYRAKFVLQSLTDVTPGAFLNNAIGPVLPWVFVYFLGGLASIILLTSCFNFTNLSIARSLNRAKEIGIRKVTGAARWQIFSQFLMESVVLALFALVISSVLLMLVKPMMLQLSLARAFKWDLQANHKVFAVFFLFAGAVGIIAGLFPALVLSRFQPVIVLKNLSSVKLFSRITLRKALLVVQFTLSLFFVLSVLIVNNQLDLFKSKDHGFNMKNKIMVRLNNLPAGALKAELLKFKNVQDVTAASHLPAAGMTRGDGFKKELSEKEWSTLNYFAVDEDYLRNMEVPMVAGKFFAPENGESNKNYIVINSEALRVFHYKTPWDAIGEEIIFQRDSSRKTIIGIVKNYNHEMLMNNIEPLALMYTPDEFSLLQVKYTGSYEEALKSIEKAWGVVNPGLKMDYKEFESEIKVLYDTLFGDLTKVMSVVAFLAIMISCLGLLGMATYTIETRMKEISIRKILGSTDRALILLLSRGFLKMLLMAVMIGVPLAWFINNLWLELMPYHTTLTIGVVSLGVLILFGLGAITIGSQTLRAAFTNPVDNLKSE